MTPQIEQAIVVLEQDNKFLQKLVESKDGFMGEVPMKECWKKQIKANSLALRILERMDEEFIKEIPVTFYPRRRINTEKFGNPEEIYYTVSSGGAQAILTAMVKE